MKREDEEAARILFDEFLNSRQSSTSLEWSQVPQVEEPPDYFLQAGSTRFAVEVTSILSHVAVASGQTPTISVLKSSRRFVEETKRIAIERDLLSGAYAISAHPLGGFSGLADEMRSQILAYIEATQEVSDAPTQKLVGKRHDNWCRFRKIWPV